jgi:hypothetical protein
MKNFAVFDIRPRRTGGAAWNKRPQLDPFAAELAAQGVYHGILPSAGATLNAAHLLLR